jgi:hypothetical protein
MDPRLRGDDGRERNSVQDRSAHAHRGVAPAVIAINR